jgi:pimeloyl-ACP methyl ester carboxylesterase
LNVSLVIAVSALILGLGFVGDASLAQPVLDRGPGRVVRLADGRRLYLDCRGEGSPTVVFVAVGGGSSVTDMPAQRVVATFTRACVYDRAGLGWSDPAPPGRSFEDRATDLHRALGTAQERGPYVLVGSSFGGLLARSYARLWAKDVDGMVLVDSAEEASWFSWMATAENENRRIALANADQARSGEMRRELEAGLAGPSWLTPDEKRWLIDDESQPQFWEANADEVAAFDRTPSNMRVAGAFGRLGARPLVVLSHGKPFVGGPTAELEPGWADAQDRLAALSSNSAHVVATYNGHVIGLENPRLVAQAVRTVVQSVRSGQPVNAEQLRASADEPPARTVESGGGAAAAHSAVVLGLDGTWEGKIEDQAAERRLILHVSTDATGTSATLDSLERGALGLPIAGLRRDGQKVEFTLPVASMSYSGTLSADGLTISGAWTRGDQVTPSNFTRTSAARPGG